MPVLTKINTNVIADDAITGAKFAGDTYLENTATQNLTGTYAESRLYTSDAYTLTGDTTVNANLVLSSVKGDDSDITLTADSTTRTLTGTGVLSGGGTLQGRNTVSGMTGVLGSVVTGGGGLTDGSNLTSLGTVASGSIGSAVTGFAGVKMVDVWRMTSDIASSTGAVYATANIERLDNYGQGDGTNAVIGGSVKMAYYTSTGYWTFPMTGVYECVFYTSHYTTTSTVTPNDYTRWFSRISGTDTALTFGGGNHGGQYWVNRTNITAIFRCADVATHFVWARFDATAGTLIAEGNPNFNYTWWKFIRLGDL